ncbi:class I SAM-dependent methyltransferase [Bacillus sp. MUM 13]|uniref:class I SAM-dependent methyltransferase n=1 Tax=Bacillus sp. MUM 13 TaxID=1678001 RepID=UPI0008F5D97D|nr:class I SAM-dependent methyltransferase [Bacillus sp. MUM 13]OIK09087.1 SAM-dependent methyltransferase [Bacillus sp. MUM 13]
MEQNTLDKITKCMLTKSDIQKVQTEHRIKLAQFWGIKEGSRLLEIGCGQGDTTAVLAYLAGETGFVHAIDIASPDYGAPATLGASADFLKKSFLGDRIAFDFETNVLSPGIDFPDNYFDFIILSHCSWYFKTSREFSSVLERTRKWGKQLCFAEWDARITSIEQYPHLLAILIQAQYESFKNDSESNVRTLFTPEDIKNIAGKAGFRIQKETSILSSLLQDAKWEIEGLLQTYNEEISLIDDMPDKLKSLIHSEVNLLKESIKHQQVKPMPIYACTAE